MFISNVLSYLIILTSTVLVIHFSNQRGGPLLLKVLYFFSLGINILQFGFTITNNIYQRMGYFYNEFNLIENILAIVWETIIITTFISSCILFEAFRLDFLIIALAQGFAIILLLK